MNYFLFLDDERMPAIAANAVYPVELRFLYRKEEWIIVRNYNSFVSYIKGHGLPICISLDYDINDNYTGYDCAVWLLDYCNSNNLSVPQVICHSWNEDGKQSIESLFRYLKE